MSSNVQEMRYPAGCDKNDLVAWGRTGMVYLERTSQTAIKTAHGDEEQPMIDIERRIYERFQQNHGHRNLLKYYGPYDSGIRLEYAAKWNLIDFLQKHPETTVEQRMRWAWQIADALGFVHAVGVIHGELTLNNILLTEKLDAKLADFGGSSLDGSDLLVAYNTSHMYPGGPSLSIQADIFALGSTLYHIMADNFPYHDLLETEHEDDITIFFAQGKFPDVSSLGPLGPVITKCWQAKYQSAIEVCKDIQATRWQKLGNIINTMYSLKIGTYSLKIPVLLLTIGVVTVVLSRGSGFRLWCWK